MNPDNPNFRTHEEEKRAEEYFRVKEQNKILREALERIANVFSEVDADVVARETLEKVK